MTKRFGLRFAAVLCLNGLVLTAVALHPTGAVWVWLPSGAAVAGRDILIPPYACLMAALLWTIVLYMFAVFLSMPVLAAPLNISCIHTHSVWLALPILWKTLWVVVARRGVY